MMIKIYNQNITNEVIDQFDEVMLDRELKFFASEMLSYGFNDMHQVNEAVERAMKICLSIPSISIRNNFKPVYISNKKEVMCDWKLSHLSRKLVIINADASIPLVANFQMKLIKNRF